ncbi:hypothetical protein PSCICJ_29520 [Pseudomonas cichorii]|nr:hypothetical protein PSCICJ_29520 [Pseudomonas cichorii]
MIASGLCGGESGGAPLIRETSLGAMDFLQFHGPLANKFAPTERPLNSLFYVLFDERDFSHEKTANTAASWPV